MRQLRLFIKRVFDILISIIILILASPLFIIISLLIYIELGSPILFKQERTGKDGKTFNIIKFRTMLELKDENNNYLPNEERQTKFGNMIRSTSIDELPELINVLKGDMSIVGPRPLLVEYLSLYTPYHQRRHEMKPGITGLAQINGRNKISWKEKFDYDLHYIDNFKLCFDLILILKTIKVVLSRDGVTFQNQSISNKYTGW